MATTTTRPMTDAQRARKVAAAKKRLAEAQALLAEVCDDYAAVGYRLTTDQRAAWSDAVDLCGPLDRMKNAGSL